MRNFRKICLGMILSLFCGIGLGKSYEKVILKNGTQLEGYISVQHPGKKIVFIAEKATVCIPFARVESIVDHDVEISSLSDGWQNWIKENPACVKEVNRKNYLVLSDIVLSANDTLAVERDSFMTAGNSRDISPHDVRILEKGSIITYLDFSKSLYHVTWDDILMIRRYERSSLDLTGIIDVVELNSGKVLEGQIIEQILGKQVRLKDNDGVVNVIDLKQITAQKKKKMNANQSLLEQSPLLEIVCTKQGKMITGIIVEQAYGKKQGDYLLIEEENGTIVRVNSGNVTEIRKIPNHNYRKLTDILVSNDEIWMNRQKAEKAIIKEDESVMVVSDKSVPIVINTRSSQDTLIVEQQDNLDNRDIFLLRLTPVEIKRKQNRYVFTYEDLVTRSSRPFMVEVSRNKTLKMSYLVNEGHYVFYKPRKKTAFYLIVN